MLNFIFGRAVCGKTTYLHKKLEERLISSKENAILIVPEQFTFETDKGILSSLGSVLSNRVEVYSFSRLAETVFSEYSFENKAVISQQGRFIYMSRALKQVQDKLSLYKNQINNPAFIESMLFVVDEFKQSSNDTKKVLSAVNELDEGILKSKMQELLVITDAYDALVERDFIDAEDYLSQFCDFLKTENYFSGKTVAIDGFNTFNAQILNIIERIMVQCDELYIAISADGFHFDETDTDVFAFPRRTASRLRNIANKNNVPIAKPVCLTDETATFNRYSSKALYHLEKNFYKTNYEVFEDETDDISIYCAQDAEDECAYTARKIRELTRNGYRCRDIAVVFRDKEKYETNLRYAFKKYEIPFFEDKRQPIINQPLVLYTLGALKICAEGFTDENILKFIKSGLTFLTTEEISEIENYVYMWDIDGNKWKTDWVDNPKGFGEGDGDNSELEKLNEMRKSIIDPLVVLKADIKNQSGLSVSKSLYEFLIKTGANEKLKQLALELEKDNEFDLALEQEQIWDLLMQVIGEMGECLKDITVSEKEYLDLFTLSLSTKSLGKVPNGIDEVIVGSADRIKTRNIKAVFVLGLNAGSFPKEISDSGLIGDRDRCKLLEKGVELFDINKYKFIQERFICYNTVCLARDKVFLSYPLLAGREEKTMPSEIIYFVEKQFPNLKKEYYDNLKIKDLIEGKTAAFELLSKHFRENSPELKNLLSYFSSLSEYKDKLETLKRVTDNLDFEFENSKNAVKLFGKDMYLSASKVEVYENCPFKYFCKYGVNAKPRKKARLDPAESGTLVHDILENLLKKYKNIGVQNVSREQRREDINEALNTYAEKYMGGLDNKGSRFVYHVKRLAKVLDTLLERLSSEFENSDFVPAEFELPIGDDESIKAYTISLSDGGSIKIHGSVDRVDKMETDNANFLRVVDYKTGIKELKLSDVLNGLNMQMLIYLIAIWRNGKGYFGDNIIPAGVLYFPANFSPFDMARKSSEEEIGGRILENGKMNGLLLDDTRVIKGMNTMFIPAKIDPKTGKAKGTVISLKQLENLNKVIDNILSDMALSLHSGKIWANPVAKGNEKDKICEYCDYHSVCTHDSNGKYRMIKSDNDKKCLEKLDGGEEDAKSVDK